MIFRPGDEQGAVFWVINGSLEVESPDGAIRVIQEGSSLGSFPRPPSFDPSTPRTRQPMHLSPTPAPKWTETCRATNLTDLVLLTLAQWEVILQSDPYCFVSKVSSFLEDLPMFSILSQAQIDILSKIARYQVFESGQIVFQQGSEGEDVYLIKTGFVRVLRDTRLEESDRNRLNHVARDNQNLDEDIAHVVTPRFAGDRPKCKAPPSFLERIPPSPMTGSGHLYSDATGSEVSPLNKKRGLGGVGATSTSDKLSSRVRQMEIRSLTGVGALSTKRLGGGLTPRATEQGDKEVAGSSTISLPPLDLTRLKKPPQLIASQELNRINNSTLYSPRSPRKLDSSPSVLIELANLGSGHIFGDIRSNSLHALITQSKMTSSPQPTPTRPFSAVCDTRVETFEIRKIDALSKIGPDIEFLWLPDGGEATSARPSAAPERSKGVGKSKALQLSTMESMGRGSFITPVVRQTKVDVKILEDVERKMKWENYKKKILLMVYEDI